MDNRTSLILAECSNQSRILDNAFSVGAWFLGRRIDQSRVWIGECPVTPLPAFINDANVRHWDLLDIAQLLVHQFPILLPAQLGERKMGEPVKYYLQVGMPSERLNKFPGTEEMKALFSLICDYGTPMDGSSWLFYDGHNSGSYLFHRRPIGKNEWTDTYALSEPLSA